MTTFLYKKFSPPDWQRLRREKKRKKTKKEQAITQHPPNQPFFSFGSYISALGTLGRHRGDDGINEKDLCSVAFIARSKRQPTKIKLKGNSTLKHFNGRQKGAWTQPGAVQWVQRRLGAQLRTFSFSHRRRSYFDRNLEHTGRKRLERFRKALVASLW